VSARSVIKKVGLGSGDAHRSPLCSFPQIIASRLVSPKLPFILSAWYARTKNSISIPHSHHHHGINDRVEKGWGVPLVMGLVPLIS